MLIQIKENVSVNNTFLSGLFEAEDVGPYYHIPSKYLYIPKEFASPITFKKDQKVLVSDDNKTWYKRYFSHIENGTYHCFLDGATSWSEAYTKFWKYCKAFADEPYEGEEILVSDSGTNWVNVIATGISYNGQVITQGLITPTTYVSWKMWRHCEDQIN